MSTVSNTLQVSGKPYVDRNRVPLEIGQKVRVQYHITHSQTAQVTGTLKGIDMYAGVTIALDHATSKNHGRFGMKYYRAGDDFYSVGIFDFYGSKTEIVGEVINKDVFYTHTCFIEVINEQKANHS